MCILNKHPCQARPSLVNVNSDETLLYPFTVSVDKFGGSCDTIDDPYVQLVFQTKLKTLEQVKQVFN